jgi:hypothetical protein
MIAKDLSFNDNIWRDIHIDVFKLEGWFGLNVKAWV